jgi:hypothetical protein
MAKVYSLIEVKTLGSNTANVNFTSIPQTYTDLYLLISARSTRATYSDSSCYVKVNSSSTSYTGKLLEGSGGNPVGSYNANTTRLHDCLIPADGAATANTFSNISVYMPNYTSSNYKSSMADSIMETSAATAYAQLWAALWSNTAAITEINLSDPLGNFKTGSTFYLYGIKNS